MLALTRQPGTPIRAHEIAAEIWPNLADQPKALAQKYKETVRYLHTLFGALDPEFDRIEQIRGRGYRWRPDENFDPLKVDPDSDAVTEVQSGIYEPRALADVFSDLGGGIEYHGRRMLFRYRGQNFKLSPVHTALVTGLLAASPRIVAYDDLAQMLRPHLIHPKSQGNMSLAREHVAKLRVKLRKINPAFDAIVPALNKGYLWSDAGD